MAGIAFPNRATYELNASAVTVREAEVPLALFSGGSNEGGSCAPGIGIATGIYDPKEQDWARIEDTAPQQSQHIGGVPLDEGSVTGAPIIVATALGEADNDNTAFVQADALTAPGAVLDAVTGAVNETGASVPAGSWAWGVIPVA